MATNQDTFTDTEETNTNHTDLTDSGEFHNVGEFPDDIDETSLPLGFVTARQLRDARNADACGALGCSRDDSLRLVSTDAGDRVLCRVHAKDYWGVSS